MPASSETEDIEEQETEEAGVSAWSGARLPFRGNGLVGFLVDVEYALAMVILAFFAFMMVVVGTIIWFGALNAHAHDSIPRQLDEWLLIFGFPFVGAAVVASAMAIIRGFESASDPRPVRVALAMWRGPAPLRPIAMLWWLGFAVAVPIVVEALIHNVVSGERHAPAGAALIQETYRIAMLLAAANAAHICFLSGIAAIYRSETFLTPIYRFRIVLDVLLVILATSLPILPVGR